MPQIFGKVGKNQPTPVSDTAQVQQRVTGYGDVVTTQLGDDHSALADEGSYFKVLSNVNTPVQHTIATSYLVNQPLFMIRNLGTAGGKRIFIDYVRLLQSTSVGTGGTQISCAAFIDTTSRVPTAGTNFTPVNVNADSTNASVCSTTGFTFGNISGSGTPNAVRMIVRHNYKFSVAANTILAGDSFTMDFGEHQSTATTLNAANIPTVYPASVGPCAIGGGHTFLFYLWYTGLTTTAPSYEFEIGWWER